jgi:hypothetical protein
MILTIVFWCAIEAAARLHFPKANGSRLDGISIRFGKGSGI